MYDPLVVDTFIRVYAEVAPAAIKAGHEARSMIDASGLSTPLDDDRPEPLTQIRANASEAAILDLCASEIASAVSAAAALQATAQCLRQLTPGTVYALFEYNIAMDLLVCHTAIGDEKRLLDGLTIRLGEKVTGWTAANRRTSVNSDASLDLMQIANFFTPPLRSTLSTPLAKGDSLVAVLTA